MNKRITIDLKNAADALSAVADALMEASISIEELEDKCAYYLTHEKERREIACNGYEEVKQHHTYPIRLAQMLQLAFQP